MIHSGTLSFLKELALNNNRDWFMAHKDKYEKTRENMLDFTSGIISGLAEADPVIPSDLKAKDCAMRIYRDIRFSKDKTPYKTNFGIAISANGKNFNGPGYYFHIEPGKSFIAGGCWMPGPEHLKAIRQEIDYNGSDFKKIISHTSFKRDFGGLSAEDKLKTVPKGYPADHPDIEILRLKSFVASCTIDDKVILSPDSVQSIVSMLKSLYPLMMFLRNAIA